MVFDRPHRSKPDDAPPRPFPSFIYMTMITATERENLQQQVLPHNLCRDPAQTKGTYPRVAGRGRPQLSCVLTEAEIKHIHHSLKCILILRGSPASNETKHPCQSAARDIRFPHVLTFSLSHRMVSKAAHTCEHISAHILQTPISAQCLWCSV